jgi:hypothetical protein
MKENFTSHFSGKFSGNRRRPFSAKIWFQDYQQTLLTANPASANRRLDAIRALNKKGKEKAEKFIFGVKC